MKDDEYEAVWQTRIRPFLRKNEDSRFKLKLWYALTFFSVIGFVPLASLVDPRYSSLDSWVIVAGLAFSGLTAFWASRIDTDFTSKFKQGVFSAVSEVADWEWSVNPDDDEGVSGEQLLAESRLYHGYDEVFSDDRLQASVQGNEIIVREVNAQVRIDDDSSYDVFDGFLAKVSVGDIFAGETFVQMEADGQLIDSGAGGLFDNKEGVEETELEWGEFERFLTVKSSNPTEARQIFTPDFMAVLYDWWQNHDKLLRIGFHNKAMYIGFPTDVSLEPRLLGGIDNERDVVRDILEFVLMLEELTQILIKEQGKR